MVTRSPELIEEQALDDFFNNHTPIDDTYMEGDVSIQYDVDRFYDEPASCTVYGADVLEFIADNFYDILDEYLISKSVQSIEELASPEDLETDEAYYSFCIDVYSEAEQYWFAHEYDDYCDEYFEAHSEVDKYL